jgi:hypothetical protein
MRGELRWGKNKLFNQQRRTKTDGEESKTRLSIDREEEEEEEERERVGDSESSWTGPTGGWRSSIC